MSLSFGAIAETRKKTQKAMTMEKVVIARVLQAIPASQLSGSSGFQPERTRPVVSSLLMGLLWAWGRRAAGRRAGSSGTVITGECSGG